MPIEVRDNFITVKVTKAEKKEITEAGEKVGKRLATFTREVALSEAKKINKKG